MSSIESLTSRIETLEKQNFTKENVSKEILAGIQNYQAQLLPRLKEIRDALEKENNTSMKGSNYIKLEEENSLLKDENKKLKNDIEKLNYRVNHLIKMLNEEENKNKNL